MSRSDGIKGCGTALVTPFLDDGSLDLEAYARLVRWQIESGIDFLVPCGTTGESVTLNEEEYRSVVGACVRAAAGKVPVVAGAGSNNTEHAIHLARIAKECGADAILSVTPYYNKPTQEGIFRHFQAISQAVPLPIVVYNVPGRTGCNILPETSVRLAGLESVIAVKEASGNIPQIMEILGAKPVGFAVLSGDDNLALTVTLLGGDGLISVVSNLIPAEMSRMIRLAREGSDLADARRIHYRYLRLMNLNFIESNPIPVKYALSRMGWIRERYRLPLCPMSPENRPKMDAALARAELAK